MTRRTIRIPPDWTVVQALAVVELLQLITDTIKPVLATNNEAER